MNNFNLLILFSFCLTITAEMTDNTIRELFTVLDTKTSPLYYCKSWTAGIPWRLPPPITCPLVSTEKPSKLVEITLWWTDITKHTLEGYECFKEREEINTFTNFFGTQYKDDYKKLRTPLSEKECKDMVKTHRTPSNEPIERLKDGLFGTNHKLKIDFHWMSTYTSYITNYYMVSLQISVADSDDFIITNAKVTEQCKYRKGVCQTDFGILTWMPGDANLCRLREGETTLCLLTDDRLSCPTPELVIEKITAKNVCGLNLGSSAQGIFFSQFNNSVKNDIAFTADIRTRVKMNVRYKRDHEVFKNGTIIKGETNAELPKMMPASQVNAKLSYLLEVVEKNFHWGIQMVHRDVCKAHQSHLELLRMLAAGGQPSVLIRTLMRSPSYRASSNGDLIQVFKCEEIYDYMLLPQSECILEWPVEFIKGTDRIKGYISGITHEIIDAPTFVACPAPIFYFEYGNATLHLTNRSVIEDIPILPSAYDESKIANMPELSFSSPGIYGVEEISGADTIVGLLKELNRLGRLESIIEAHSKGITLSPAQQQSVKLLREFLLTPFQNFLASICLGLITIFLASILFKFCYLNRNKIMSKMKNKNSYRTTIRRRQPEPDYVSLEMFEPVNSISIDKIKRVKAKRLARKPIIKPRPRYMYVKNVRSKQVQTSPNEITDTKFTKEIYPTDELKKLQV